MQIWDTGGEDFIKIFPRSYCKLYHGIILIYDITDKDSFKRIRSWIRQIKNYEKNM